MFKLSILKKEKNNKPLGKKDSFLILKVITRQKVGLHFKGLIEKNNKIYLNKLNQINLLKQNQSKVHIFKQHLKNTLYVYLFRTFSYTFVVFHLMISLISYEFSKEAIFILFFLWFYWWLILLFCFSLINICFAILNLLNNKNWQLKYIFLHIL